MGKSLRNIRKYQYFLKEFVKTNKFSVDSSNIVLSASRIRTASDYDDFYLASKDEAAEQIENAIRFFEEVKEYLNKQS